MMESSARPRRLWLRDPLAILAEGAGGGLVVEGTRIAERVPAGGRPAGPVDATFDAARHVVIPGLVNTHHHVFQTLTRAHPSAINKPLFPWLKALYAIWGRLTPEAFRLATRLAYTELLLSGCTTAGDHHYLFPRGLEAAVDIQVEEARALGIRAVVTRGSMSLSQKQGGLPPETLVQDDDTILADSERVLRLFHDPAPGAMVQIGLAPCSPFAVTKRLMRESAGLAERHDCRLHTHLGETRDENAYCLEVFGQRPVDYLEEVGWMTRRVGRLEPGREADLALFTLDELRFSGAHDPLAALVLCGAHRADRVMVAGTWRVIDGQPLGIETGRLREEHSRLARHLFGTA